MKNFYNGGGSVVSLEKQFVYYGGVEGGRDAVQEETAVRPDAETQASLASLAESMGVKNIANLTAGHALSVAEAGRDDVDANDKEAEQALADLEKETGEDLVAESTEKVEPKPDKLVFSAAGKPDHIKNVTSEMAAQFGGSDKTLAAQMAAMEAMDSFA